MITAAVTHHAALPFIPARANDIWELLSPICLFFMATGAFMFPMDSHGMTPWQYAGRRLRLFAPAFAAWTLLYAMLSHWFPATYTCSDNLRWILFTPTWGPGWFGLTLIGLYLLMPVVSPWLATAPRRHIEWILALWLAAGGLPVVSLHTPVDIPAGIFGGIFNYMGYMIAGYWLLKWPPATWSKRRRITLAAAGLALGPVLSLTFYPTAARWGYAHVWANDLSINRMSWALLLFALVVSLRTLPPVLRRLTRTLGTNTLPVYLSHWLFTAILAPWLQLDFAATMLLTAAGCTLYVLVRNTLLKHLRHPRHAP